MTHFTKVIFSAFIMRQYLGVDYVVIGFDMEVQP